MSKPWEVTYDSGSSDKESTKPFPACEKDPLVKKRQKSMGFDCWGGRTWFQDLNQVFGYRLLVLLSSVHHLLKGFGMELAAKASPYMFRAYHVPAPQAQIFLGVAALPWAMKPMIGLISDLFPICGFKKGPYMSLTSVLAVAALVCLGCMTEVSMSVSMAVMCLFFFTLQVSTTDLLAEAKYSESIVKNPTHGPSLVSYVWSGMQMAGMFAIAGSGVALEYFGFRWLFVICIIPAALVLLPVSAGYMEEQCLDEDQIAEGRRRFWRQPELCFLCLIMFIATLTLITSGMLVDNTLANATLAVVVAVVVLTCFSVVLSPTIAKFNAFALIQTACSLSTSGASFYFYTDTPEQYPATSTSPGGPHFSMFFYNSVLGTSGAIFSLIGIWTYKRYLSTWRYRSLLVFTSLMLSFFSLIDLIFFARINVRLGIPDEAFVLGASVFESIIAMWQWMPQVIVMSYMVPQGMEATMFALLAGCHNLGTTIAANCGALLLDHLDVRPSGAVGETAQFDKLWVASAIATGLPLIAVCTLFWLIPDVSQTERLTDAANDSVTAGSLWRRWRGVEDSARMLDPELPEAISS